MITKNPFFFKKDYLFLKDIYKNLGLKIKEKNIKIVDIKDLAKAKSNEISFFNSLKYLDLLKKTKAKFVLTEKKYENIVEKNCKSIVVKNVLVAASNITNLFYPEALNDTIDFNVNSPDKKNINLFFLENMFC